jgi:hypothetical protein
MRAWFYKHRTLQSVRMWTGFVWMKTRPYGRLFSWHTEPDITHQITFSSAPQERPDLRSQWVMTDQCCLIRSFITVSATARRWTLRFATSIKLTPFPWKLNSNVLSRKPSGRQSYEKRERIATELNGSYNYKFWAVKRTFIFKSGYRSLYFSTHVLCCPTEYLVNCFSFTGELVCKIWRSSVSVVKLTTCMIPECEGQILLFTASSIPIWGQRSPLPNGYRVLFPSRRRAGKLTTNLPQALRLLMCGNAIPHPPPYSA